MIRPVVNKRTDLVQVYVRQGDVPSCVHLVDYVSLDTNVDVAPEGCHEVGIGDHGEFAGEREGRWNVEGRSEGDHAVTGDLRRGWVGQKLKTEDVTVHLVELALFL